MKTSFNQIRSLTGVNGSLFLCLLAFPAAFWGASLISATKPAVITLLPGATSVEIQQALDRLPASGGEVVLPPGTFEVGQPIVLRRDHESLRGSGDATVLRLADGANCPVIILGEPINHPRRLVKDLRVSGLFIDGNRYCQQRELWRLSGEGSEIRNNGITVLNVSDSVVEHVICSRCRSGGLVTTRGVRRVTVWDLTAFDNEFDGLACYRTTDCLFTRLYLHDNPGAGISLDLAFNYNVISNAVLNANGMGIFMRASRNNHFQDISISNSRYYGVFMADAGIQTARGWQPAPRTECADNFFTNLTANNCGGAAFWVNNPTCTNNIIVGARFDGHVRGGLSLAQPDSVALR